MGTEIKTWMVVGAQRWPYHAAHPECWLQPWKGVVLDRDDPRAWAESVAFPTKRPNRQQVKAHVAAHPTLANKLPVLWNFGTYKKIFWESVENLRSYEGDVAAWEADRALALQEADAQKATYQARVPRAA